MLRERQEPTGGTTQNGAPWDGGGDFYTEAVLCILYRKSKQVRQGSSTEREAVVCGGGLEAAEHFPEMDEENLG